MSTKFFAVAVILQFAVYSACFSQAQYKGSVIDVGTRQPVENVKVQLQNSGRTTYTNDQGNFVFLDLNTNQDSLAELKGQFHTQGNVLIWSFNKEFNLQVYGPSGMLMKFYENLPPEGYMSFQQTGGNFYLLKAYDQSSSQVFKMIALGNQLIVSDNGRSSITNGAKNIQDSLLLTKPAYYHRKIAVGSTEQNLRPNILRKKYDELHYFNELVSRAAFDMIQSSPSKTQFGEVASVKILYDRELDLLYYINNNRYTNHYIFAVSWAGFKGDAWTFNFTQYVNVPQRYLYPATLNYYSGLDIYTLEFFSGDGATCDDIERVYEKILQTSYINNNLFFYSTNNSWENCSGMPTVTANEIYAGQNYQALCLEESYGFLRKVDIADLNKTHLNRHDILVLNGIPFDISVVSGIITTDFQTPLSHINVLSHNRGTPNMALRDAYTNPILDSLYGELVFLKVESDSFYIRKAGIEEANVFWLSKEPKDTIFLVKDVETSGLVNLDQCTILDVRKIGGKAANFAEMLNAYEENEEEPLVPEGYFAIPFYYYEQHMQRSGLNSLLQDMLGNPEFYLNIEFRSAKLKLLQDSIISYPLNQDLVELVTARINATPEFDRFRFRSSTNAEDLEGFNGAGLYDSFTGAANDMERPVDAAIKKVWASLWNLSAFEERSYFKIAHETCAMGVLVHRSFPDENANGVALTRNLYNSNAGFIVNVQFGENSIVEPEPGTIHDQIILYEFSLTGREPYTIEYISHSNILPENQTSVLSDQELFMLADQFKMLKSYFYNQVYNCQCNFNTYGLDIEFKIDSELENRKIYIKQVRPY